MRKIPIYSGDAVDTSGPNFGYAVLKTNAMGNLDLDIKLVKLKPGTAYDIRINQYPAIRLLSEPTVIVTTDKKGKGNADVSVARITGKSGFWITVTGGDEVFRSAAVELN